MTYPPSNPWLPHHFKLARDLRAKGHNNAEIAAALGFHTRTVQKHMGGAGFARPGGPRPALWTDDNIAILRRHIETGLSATDTAAEMQVSRNAVIGKASRLGVHFKSVWGRSQNSPRVKKPPKPAKIMPSETSAKSRVKAMKEADEKGLPRPAWVAPREVSADIAAKPRPWTTRKTGECAWPVDGEGADVRSCCNRTDLGSVYCPAHRAVAFYPSKMTQRDLARSLRRVA